MELKYIEAFLKIVETGSFSAAAELLFISQPTISVRIQQLEKELNKPLFIRVDGKKVKLSPEGERILPYFKEALSLINKGCEEIKGEEQVQDIIISCPKHMGIEIMPELLSTLYKTFPNFEFKVKIDGIKHQRHDIDIAFVYSLQEEMSQYQDFSKLHVADEKNILVCNPDHPLVYLNKVSIQKLKDERMFIYERDLLSTRLIETFLEANNVRDFKKVEINNFSWIKTMVSKGLGIAFLQEIMVKDELENGKLKEIAIKEDIPTTSIYLLFSSRVEEYVRNTTIKTTKALFQNENN